MPYFNVNTIPTYNPLHVVLSGEKPFYCFGSLNDLVAPTQGYVTGSLLVSNVVLVNLKLNSGNVPVTAQLLTTQGMVNETDVAGAAIAAAVSLTLTAAANASAGSTVYTGTITGGGTNAFIGALFTVAGFDTAANNGVFVCTASSSTTLTLTNPNGVSDTHAGTASYGGVQGFTANVNGLVTDWSTGQVGYALTSANVAYAADTGAFIMPQVEVGEAMVNGSVSGIAGASRPVTFSQDGTHVNNAKAVKLDVIFPSLASITAATITWQEATVPWGPYADQEVVTTVASGVQTGGQLTIYPVIGRWGRFNIESFTGTGTIVARVTA